MRRGHSIGDICAARDSVCSPRNPGPDPVIGVV